MKILSDEDIVGLYWNRNEFAIAETGTKYRRYLYTVINNILDDEFDTEECLNDTYLAAWNSIPPHHPSDLKTFLTKISRRIAVDRYRKRIRKKRIPDEYIVSFSELEDTLINTCGYEMPCEAEELGAAISQYLYLLEQNDRFIFISRYYFSDKISDIAEMICMSESSVNKKLKKLREGLRDFLMKEGYFG